MSSLWTPGGEHDVPRSDRPGPEQPAPSAPPRPGTAGGPDSGGPELAGAGGPGGPGGPDFADADPDAATLAEIRRQLLAAPAEVVIANHVYGLFELAALHLSQEPPDLDAARLAIDAMAAVVEGLGDRLGEVAPDLAQGLANLRMAYVQVQTRGGSAN